MNPGFQLYKVKLWIALLLSSVIVFMLPLKSAAQTKQILSATCTGPMSARPHTGDFKTTLQYHLDAVTHRNLEGIINTVADSVTLIFSDGGIIHSKKKFVDFHRDFFNDTTWHMRMQVMHIEQSAALSYAFVKYQYRKFDVVKQITTKSDIYLVLIFQKQAAGWMLIHDQNAKIQP